MNNLKKNQHKVIEDTIEIIPISTPNSKSGFSKRESSRLQIIDAASKLVVEQNFYDVCMKEIAVRAGVSRATLYRYYSTKEQIFIDAAAIWAMNFFDQIRQHPPTEETVGGRATNLFERTVNAVANTPGLMAAYIATMTSNELSLKNESKHQKALMPYVINIAMAQTKSPNEKLTSSVMQHILISNLLLLNAGKIDRHVFVDEMCKVAESLLSDVWDKA